MKRSRLLALRVLAAAALLTAGVFVYRYARATAAEPIGFPGNVEIRDVTLAFRVSGRVVEVKKQEGDRVEKGEVIARLDAAPYRVSLKQAEAAVGVVQAQQTRTEAGSRSEDIREALARLAERRAAQQRANDGYERTERLRRENVATEQDLVDAKSARDQALAAVAAARASLERVRNGSRAEDIAIAAAQVTQAEVAVEAARLSLEDTELRAPGSGTVVTRVVEPGAMVAAGSPVLVVAIDEPVWVRAYASEKELARVAPGTAVDVYTDARPEQPYRGQVGYVATQAEFTPKNVETEEQRTSLVYRFRVVVTEHDEGLRQGMPVRIRLASDGGQSP